CTARFATGRADVEPTVIAPDFAAPVWTPLAPSTATRDRLAQWFSGVSNRLLCRDAPNQPFRAELDRTSSAQQRFLDGRTMLAYVERSLRQSCNQEPNPGSAESQCSNPSH